MSKTLKYFKIKSFSKEELKDLFDAICTNIIKSTPTKVKQDVLKLTGTKKELEAFNPTITSLLTLITTYDIKFEFMVKYVEQDFSEPIIEESINPVKKEMIEQAKDIEYNTGPNYIGGKKVEVVEIDNTPKKHKPIKEEEFPDFE